MSLTDEDKQWLLEHFATKAGLEKVETALLEALSDRVTKLEPPPQ